MIGSLIFATVFIIGFILFQLWNVGKSPFG
jgi:hypothetical protein